MLNYVLSYCASSIIYPCMVIDHKFENTLPIKERLEEISGREYHRVLEYWQSVYTFPYYKKYRKITIFYSESAGGVRYRVLHSKSMNFARSTNAIPNAMRAFTSNGVITSLLCATPFVNRKSVLAGKPINVVVTSLLLIWQDVPTPFAICKLSKVYDLIGL